MSLCLMMVRVMAVKGSVKMRETFRQFDLSYVLDESAGYGKGYRSQGIDTFEKRLYYGAISQCFA